MIFLISVDILIPMNNNVDNKKENELENKTTTLREAEEAGCTARRAWEEFMKGFDWNLDKMNEEERIKNDQLWAAVKLTGEEYNSAYVRLKKFYTGGKEE